MSKYHKRLFCKPCGWSVEAPFGDIFHVHQTVCPRCGQSKPDELWRTDTWEIRTVKWVSRSVWWRPSTWGAGRYEKARKELSK